MLAGRSSRWVVSRPTSPLLGGVIFVKLHTNSLVAGHSMLGECEPSNGLHALRPPLRCLRATTAPWSTLHKLTPGSLPCPYTGDTCPYIAHIVATGDTCLALAVSYRVTLEEVRKANPGMVCEVMQPGQRLCIPKTANGKRQGYAWVASCCLKPLTWQQCTSSLVPRRAVTLSM